MSESLPERRPDAPPSTIQGRVITPTATAGPVASSVTKLGEILHNLVHASPQAFHGETQQLAAHDAISSWVGSHVKPSEKAALNVDDHRAPVEDVTKRVAPNQTAYSVPVNAPAQIDYAKLAAEIVRQQQAAAQAEVTEEAE